MIKTDTQAELDKNIPNEAVSTREQSGQTLSYLEAWYVIDRLNQVLGQGNWGYDIKALTKVFEGMVAQRNGEAFSTSYVATITLSAMGQSFTEVGYGSGTDYKNPGNAHELASKGAVSDALKRAAKNLGRSMGLALYDKTQEFVGEAPVKTVAPETVNKVQEVKVPVTKQRPFKEMLKEAFNILEAQQKLSHEKRSTLQGGIPLSKMTSTQAEKVFIQVKKDFPTLNLV